MCYDVLCCDRADPSSGQFISDLAQDCDNSSMLVNALE